jgi:hypothetical protein
VKLLIIFLFGIFALSAHQQSKGADLRFRWVLMGSLVLAASMYSLSVVS